MCSLSWSVSMGKLAKLPALKFIDTLSNTLMFNMFFYSPLNHLMCLKLVFGTSPQVGGWQRWRNDENGKQKRYLITEGCTNYTHHLISVARPWLLDCSFFKFEMSHIQGRKRNKDANADSMKRLSRSGRHSCYLVAAIVWEVFCQRPMAFISVSSQRSTFHQFS